MVGGHTSNDASCATECNWSLAVQMLSQDARRSTDNLKLICCVTTESLQATLMRPNMSVVILLFVTGFFPL
jgi:hypothetical protein